MENPSKEELEKAIHDVFNHRATKLYTGHVFMTIQDDVLIKLVSLSKLELPAIYSSKHKHLKIPNILYDKSDEKLYIKLIKNEGIVEDLDEFFNSKLGSAYNRKYDYILNSLIKIKQ